MRCIVMRSSCTQVVYGRPCQRLEEERVGLDCQLQQPAARAGRQGAGRRMHSAGINMQGVQGLTPYDDLAQLAGRDRDLLHSAPASPLPAFNIFVHATCLRTGDASVQGVTVCLPLLVAT